MDLILEGHHLPGASCGGYDDVHVGVQVGRVPEDLVRGDAASARWEVDVAVRHTPDGVDFSGPAVHGRRGERFVYLTWGEGTGTRFAMFRRAKLMLAEVPDPTADTVTARVHLTDERGMPRCARLRPPALEWL